MCHYKNMVKQFVLFTVVAFLFIFSTAPTRALTSTSSANKREEIKASASAKREEVKQNIEEKRTAARERWQAIKDERKLSALERIETHLANINARITAHFARVLTRLEAILAKISTRASRAAQNGKDISSVTEATASATKAINSAKEAVASQSAKTYEVTITDESAAKQIVQTAMQQLKADLAAVRQIVTSAREAVHAAAQALRTVIGTEAGEGATP